MTERQQRFAVEYIKDGNATQAAIRAGFSPNGAGVHANRMLKDANVAARIAELRAPVIEEAGLTLEGHIRKLAALRDAAENAEQFSAAITAEVNRGKVAGFYTERVEHSGELEMLAFRRRSTS
jgi:phage terminase small subunit